MVPYTAVHFKNQTEDKCSLPTIVENPLEEPNTKQDNDHHAIDKSILGLGFMTGYLLETCDVGVQFVDSLHQLDLLWQQMAVSMVWSLMVTVVACIIMVCIQNVSSNKNKKECQATFLMGTVVGLACAIVGNQIMKTSASPVLW